MKMVPMVRRIKMCNQRITVRLVTAVVAGLIFATPMVAQASPEAPRSVNEPVPSEPETTDPETTEPESTDPDTTAPTETDPDGAQSDSATVAVIAVIGFSALLALASWWMVRRRGGDDAPHPPHSTRDEPLPGQDLW